MSGPLMESAPAAETVIDGRRYLYFGGTGYFSLQNHPTLLQAAAEALTRYGMHSATWRGGFGTTPLYVGVEQKAAEFFGTEDAAYIASDTSATSPDSRPWLPVRSSTRSSSTKVLITASPISSVCSNRRRRHSPTPIRRTFGGSSTRICGPGRELSLLIDPGVREWADIAAIVQANLAQAGIKVKIEGFARPTMRAKLDKADFDMATGFWTPDYPDADMFTWFWFYSKNGGLAGNRSFYSNPRMDKLVVAQRQEPTPAKRLQLFRQIQKTAVDDAVYVYLHQPVYRITMRSRVKGYVYNPMLLFMPNFSGISKTP